MKYPLIFLTIFFCLGIAFVNLLNVGFLYFYFGAWMLFVFCVVFLRKPILFDFLLLFLVFSLGGLILADSFILPKNHLARLLRYRKNQIYTLKGFIVSRPLFKDNRTRFIMDTREIKIEDTVYRCSGKVLVYLSGRQKLEYADELLLKARLSNNLYIRQWKRDNNLYHKGIYMIAYASPTVVINRDKSIRYLPGYLAFKLASHLESIVKRHLSSVPANILSAMILGRREGLSGNITNIMIRSGTIHILVVSGFHVGLIAFLVLEIFKIFGLSNLVRFILAMFCLFIYCLMTGASSPTLRATIMTGFFLLGFLLRREGDIYNFWSAALVLLLVFNPRQIFEVGFQLSFLSVFSIIFFYPRLKTMLKIKNIKPFCLRKVLELLIISFSAWIGAIFPLLYHFRIFSPVTVLANLFAVPLAVFIVLSGVSMLAVGLINPFLGSLFARTVEIAVVLLISINTFLVRLPGAYFYLKR